MESKLMVTKGETWKGRDNQQEGLTNTHDHK